MLLYFSAYDRFLIDTIVKITYTISIVVKLPIDGNMETDNKRAASYT